MLGFGLVENLGNLRGRKRMKRRIEFEENGILTTVSLIWALADFSTVTNRVVHCTLVVHYELIFLPDLILKQKMLWNMDYGVFFSDIIFLIDYKRWEKRRVLYILF